MGKSSSSTAIERRDFLSGCWRLSDTNKKVEIASLLVQTKPERLADAARAIQALPGTEIYSRDPRGKLVVVVEASDVDAVGAALNTISMMPEVLTAALVFHGTDEA